MASRNAPSCSFSSGSLTKTARPATSSCARLFVQTRRWPQRRRRNPMSVMSRIGGKLSSSNTPRRTAGRFGSTCAWKNSSELMPSTTGISPGTLSPRSPASDIPSLAIFIIAMTGATVTLSSSRSFSRYAALAAGSAPESRSWPILRRHCAASSASRRPCPTPSLLLVSSTFATKTCSAHRLCSAIGSMPSSRLASFASVSTRRAPSATRRCTACLSRSTPCGVGG
mmetsp:Transcript_85697/g.243027  ORF Transcript_85697/g.243027 Transcript_85697/m.243027 type:complete len:226 (+) Transcript_85697:612-1289(+)